MRSREPPGNIPTSSGIYQIRCRQNGKIYIGSAINLHVRWRGHRRDLCNGVHVNPHLQSAWNLYGEESSAFCRQHGLDDTHMVAVARGRILSHRGWTHVRGRKRLVVHKGFIAPGGAVVRITNLSAFCRASGLCAVHMHELKSGKRPSHKGWTWKQDADKVFDELQLA